MPVTDDFSYQLRDTGTILNPDSLVAPFVDITSADGFDSAPFRTTERDHEGQDGGFMDAAYEKGRPVVLEGTVYATHADHETFLDQLKYEWAPSSSLVPLYFKKPGVTERFLRVKPLGCRYNMRQMRRQGVTEIQFQAFAEDPRIYSASLRDYSVNQAPVILSGRSYNKSYNYSYGVPITPDVVNMFVGGNRTTPVTFTITGPASYPTIINESLGVQMRFNLDIPAGSILTVNTYYHTVYLDGQNRRSALNSPTWFNLMPGNNYIRYSSATAGDSVLTGQCFDAWR